MRLTLRTLLAYLDDVLEPEDAETLKDKIEGSRNAKTLVENIRQGLRRPQLSAPSLDGKGMGGNPNSVSEYLDNTLSVERIPEIERNCLESDVLLVEVAACHQILTMAVGRSAEADAELRNRIYALPNSPTNWVSESGKFKLVDLNAPVPGSQSDSRKGDRELVSAQIINDTDSFRIREQHASAAATRPAATIRQKGLDLTESNGDNGVPAYLRMSKSRGWNQALVTGALITVLLVVLWQAIGSMDRLKSLIASKAANVPGAGDATTASNKAGSLQTPMANTPPNNSAADNATKGDATKGDLNKNKADAEKNAIASTPTPAESSTSSAKNSGETTPGPKAPVPATADNVNAQAGNSAKPSETMDTENVAQPVIDKVPPSPNPLPTTPSNPPPPNGLNASVVIGGTWLPSDRVAAEAIVLAWEKPATPEQIVRIERLAPGVGMKLGSSVLVPPAYRTVFSLPPGIRLETFGPTEVEFVRGVPKPAIRLHRGRVVLSSSPDCKDCEVEWGGQRVALKWDAAPSACAIELFQMFIPGTDGQSIQSSMQILPVEGSVSCTLSSLVPNDSGEPTIKVIEPGQVFVIQTGGPPDVFKVTELPPWVNGQSERPIDIAAATELAPMLKYALDGNPIEELRSMVSYRRNETAALAVRTLVQFGMFDPLFGPKGLLNNTNARSHWEFAVSDMRTTLASHPDLVGRLVQDIEATCGDRANRIKWLILGPSNEQLIQGGDRELVEFLNSQFLDERVLASNFLRFITGQDFGYLPERPTPESLIAWKKFLSDKAIRLPQTSVAPPLPANP